MAEKLILNEAEEMFLEKIWLLIEAQQHTITAVPKSQLPQEAENMPLFERLLALKFLTVDGDNLQFTPPGVAYAKDIMRRRRLTELLLFNILKADLDSARNTACKIEHIISSEVTDKICAFLGHPTLCPHQWPIPPGLCCTDRDAAVKPLIEPLAGFTPGEKGKVMFITVNDHHLLNRLTSLGLYPGAILTLRQHKPTAIVRIGETDIAIEPKLTRQIYCRPLTGK